MACQKRLFDAERQDTVQISVRAGIQADTVFEFNTSLHGNGTIINAGRVHVPGMAVRCIGCLREFDVTPCCLLTLSCENGYCEGRNLSGELLFEKELLREEADADMFWEQVRPGIAVQFGINENQMSLEGDGLECRFVMLRPCTLWLWRSPWISVHVPHFYDRQILYFLRDHQARFRTPFVLTCSTCKSQWQEPDEVNAMPFGSFIKFKRDAEDLSRSLPFIPFTTRCHLCNYLPCIGEWQQWRHMDGGRMSIDDFAYLSNRHYVREINQQGYTNHIWCFLCSDCLPLWTAKCTPRKCDSK